MNTATSDRNLIASLRKPLTPAVALGVALCLALPCAAGEGKLSIDCGQAHATLQCSPRTPDCTRTTLRLQASVGSSLKLLSKPKGMARYTAVGLACARAQDATPYLLVQFGERPEGCKFCEWVHVYTVQGRVLTRSQPPILRDDTQPDQSALMPNNGDFNRLSKKLGLERPRFEFLK
jgi:hypothetical protein